VIGVVIVCKVMVELLCWIVENVGFEGYVVVEKVCELFVGYGLNVVIGVYGDLLVEGVIDLVKVICLVLCNVVFIVLMVFMIDILVVEKKEEIFDFVVGYGYGYGYGY